MLNKDIKEEIKRCSRCALCIENCPIYEIKKDENNTARGLICKLNGYNENKLSINEIKKDLKICLNCKKCKKNCPPKINTTNIFAYKNAELCPSKFSQRLFLKLKLLPIKILYFLNFFSFLKGDKKSTNSTNIFYFKGCFSKAQHKKTFLDEILKNPDFACCALPYLVSGDIKNYKKAKEKNIELIKKSSLVVFDCASCKSAVEDYFENNSSEKEKLIFFSDLINNKINLKIKNGKKKFKNKTITIHKPCHLSEDDFLKIENLIKNIDGINYKRLEKYNSCCGFGGSYFIFHPIISTKIALKKAKTIEKTNVDLILTMCPSCTLGLRFGQLISFNFKKTMELRDFFNTYFAYDKL